MILILILLIALLFVLLFMPVRIELNNTGRTRIITENGKKLIIMTKDEIRTHEAPEDCHYEVVKNIIVLRKDNE